MTESVTIKVDGMVCAACQSHVQRALEGTRGGSKGAVNLMTGQAVVAFDPVTVAPQNLVQAILDTGYDAELPRSGRSAIEEQEERERDQVTEARELTLKAIVSLLAGALAMGVSMWGGMRMMHSQPVQYRLPVPTLFTITWPAPGTY